MGYKVYYDEIWELVDIIRTVNSNWNEKFNVLSEKFEAFNDPEIFKGKGAESINTYFSEVHGTIIGQLRALYANLEECVQTYRSDYENQVDSGDGSETGVRFTTMVEDELKDGGKVCKNVNNMIDLNSSLRSDVNNIRYSIMDILSLGMSSAADNVERDLYEAKRIATDLNSKVLSNESKHRGRLDGVADLIGELKSIINYQLHENRKPLASYASGDITSMCDYNKLAVASEKVIANIEALQDEYSKSLENTFDRQALLDKEKEQREKEANVWRWVAVGVCLVASVAVTVATAGAATPLVLGAVGAATGIVSGVTNELADQYVETGFENGVDWSEVGKVAVVSGVTGFVAGYAGGAIAGGSGVKTVVQKVGQNIGKEVISNVSGCVAGTLYDIGESAITGKPLETTAGDFVKELGREVVGGTVEGIVGTAFGELTDKIENKVFDGVKSGIKKDLGKIAYSTAADVVEGVAETVPIGIAKEAYSSALSKEEKFSWGDAFKETKEKLEVENLAKSALNSAVNTVVKDHIADELVDEDKKFKKQMEQKAGKDGKLDMIQFENGKIVLEEDYIAAKNFSKNATVLDREFDSKRNKNVREVLGVKTTQGATKIQVDADKVKKADYKGKSKVTKFEIIEENKK